MGRPANSVARLRDTKVAVSPSGCWVWEGKIAANGYGHATVGYRTVLAHRLFYEADRGPIPSGLTIDHLCRNKACVNPQHMEAVTQQINNLRSDGPSGINARKTVCIHGHPLSGSNVYMRPDRPGHRHCKACQRNAAAKRASKKGLRYACS